MTTASTRITSHSPVRTLKLKRNGQRTVIRIVFHSTSHQRFGVPISGPYPTNRYNYRRSSPKPSLRTCAYHAEPNAIKRDEIAARQLRALQTLQFTASEETSPFGPARDVSGDEGSRMISGSPKFREGASAIRRVSRSNMKVLSEPQWPPAARTQRIDARPCQSSSGSVSLKTCPYRKLKFGNFDDAVRQVQGWR